MNTKIWRSVMRVSQEIDWVVCNCITSESWLVDGLYFFSILLLHNTLYHLMTDFILFYFFLLKGEDWNWKPGSPYSSRIDRSGVNETLWTRVVESALTYPLEWTQLRQALGTSYVMHSPIYLYNFQICVSILSMIFELWLA